LAFSGENTVIALAGATGSGKSSLLNAISGTQLAFSGVKRPTTTHPLAVVWADNTPDDLLDWMNIPLRHRLAAVDTGASEAALAGLVLLDLPDYDSTELSHRDEMNRLIGLVDAMIWVLDPQKYADNALHSGYLERFREYADVMLVVLNQSDRLSPDDLVAAHEHLRKLLASEGLGKVRVLNASALTGDGIAELRSEIATLVKSKRLAAARLLHDVTAGALALSSDLNRERHRKVSNEQANRLVNAVLVAAGVDQVANAVGQATRIRGGLATGWPLISWIGKLRPDPLKRLHLEALVPAERSDTPELAQRTALQTSDVARAQVHTALRDTADDVSRGLSSGWTKAIRQASLSHEDTLIDELDIAVATADLGTTNSPSWWSFVRVLQWFLIAAALTGLLWLGSGSVLEYFKLAPLPLPQWHGVAIATWLFGGALVAGFLLGLLTSLGVRISAERRTTAAATTLRQAVRQVANQAVLTPVNTELERYARFVAALARAL
jgi:GTPase Era involved in 16S rRNA processing